METAQRVLGLGRCTSLVVGNIVGAGLLMLPASLGIYGTLGLLGWGLTSIGAICLALIFARLAREVPKIGGPYAYSRAAFGDFVGFQMAWSYWCGTWASNAALATAFVSYLSVFFPELADNLFMAFAISFSVVWFLTFVNILGIREAAIVQVIITILKILPLAAIGIFGLVHINIDHFTPLNPSGTAFWPAISSAAALTLFSFLGLESATVPADDVKNPEKTIPLATILGTVISTIIYIWMMVTILGIIPPETLAQSTAPFADAARVIFGDWAVPIIAASALLAVFGTLNGWILLQGQIPVAAAQDKLFPAFFGKLNKKHAPWLSLIISASLMTGMLLLNYQANLTDQFTTIVAFTTFAVLLPYLYSAVAELYFLIQDKQKMSSGRYWRSLTVAFLAFLYTVFIVGGAGQEAVYMGMIFVFAGFPLYVLMKRKTA
jgi:APA family basic amino acid/polyamine antiporter